MKTAELTAEAHALRLQIEEDRARNAQLWTDVQAELAELAHVEQRAVERSERRGFTLAAVALALQAPLVAGLVYAVVTGMGPESVDSVLKTVLGIGTGLILLIVSALLVSVVKIFTGLRQLTSERFELRTVVRARRGDQDERDARSVRAGS